MVEASGKEILLPPTPVWSAVKLADDPVTFFIMFTFPSDVALTAFLLLIVPLIVKSFAEPVLLKVTEPPVELVSIPAPIVRAPPVAVKLVASLSAVIAPEVDKLPLFVTLILAVPV